MKNVVIYVRVSTEEQAEGSSLDVQQAACRTFCDAQGVNVVRVFRDEGESAKSDDRPQFQAMIRFCMQKGNRVDHVVVHKADRFARSAEDYYYHSRTLRERGVTLLSATEEVDGGDYVQKLLRGILAHIAEFDNDVRADRSRQGMRSAAERGGWCFRAPLGYQRARSPAGLPILEPDPETGPLVQKLFEAMAGGRCSTISVCDHAASLGLRTRYGKPLHVQAVAKLLRNPIYAGRIEGKLTGGRPVKAAFPPLIPEELFDRVQVALARRSHAPSPHVRNNPDFPLRRLVLCSACGNAVTGSHATGRAGRKYAQYRCAQEDCRAVNVRADALHRAFLQLLLEIKIETTPLLQKFREYVLDEWQQRHAEVIAAQGQLKAQAEALVKKQATLLDRMLEGTVDQATYRKKNEELTQQLALARGQYQEAAGKEWDIETAINLAVHLVQNAGRLWVKMESLDRRQRLQGALFPDGLVYHPDEGFGTAANTYPVRTLREFGGDDSRMAPPTGFEPVLPG